MTAPSLSWTIGQLWMAVVLGVGLILSPSAVRSQIIVTSNADDGSPGTLRYAIEHADSGAVITFAPAVRDTIHLALGQLVVETDLSIVGPGMDQLAVSGDGLSRVLINHASSLRISGLTLTRGHPREGLCGGALRNEGGPLYLTDVRVSDSRAADGEDRRDLTGRFGASGGVGGGICILTGKLWMTDSEVVRNRAGDGGGGSPGYPGGSGGFGGGIYGDADLERVLVKSNVAGTGGWSDYRGGKGGEGGGLYGRMNIRESRIEDNQAGAGSSISDNAGSGDGGHGGGYSARYPLGKITRSRVHNNRAGDGGSGQWGGIGGSGGGVYGSIVEIVDTEISGNRAGNGGLSGYQTMNNGGDGGGVAVIGTVSITGSSLVGNQAGDGGAPTGFGGRGGGVYALWPSERASIHKSTISGNRSGTGGAGEAGFGGGIAIDGSFVSRPFDLSSSTVVGNDGSGGGLAMLRLTRDLTIKNSILAGNMVRGDESSVDADCRIADGTVTTDHILTVGGRGCPAGVNGIRLKPQHIKSRLVEPLADNGGPTPTHALHPSSPAIDAGYCPDDETDQRGYGNPDGERAVDLGKKNPDTACDIGAFEFRAEPIVVAELAGKGVQNLSKYDADLGGFKLEPVYPNPSNGVARSAFSIPETQSVRVSVYDLLGREMQTPFDAQAEGGRTYPIRIDGSGLPAGSYFLRVGAPSGSRIQTFVMVR